MLKYFLFAIGGSLVLFVISVILHNAISAISGIEEPVFFLMAVIVAPAAFVIGTLGSVVIIVRRVIQAHRA